MLKNEEISSKLDSIINKNQSVNLNSFCKSECISLSEGQNALHNYIKHNLNCAAVFARQMSIKIGRELLPDDIILSVVSKQLNSLNHQQFIDFFRSFENLKNIYFPPKISFANSGALRTSSKVVSSSKLENVASSTFPATQTPGKASSTTSCMTSSTTSSASVVSRNTSASVMATKDAKKQPISSTTTKNNTKLKCQDLKKMFSESQNTIKEERIAALKMEEDEEENAEMLDEKASEKEPIKEALKSNKSNNIAARKASTKRKIDQNLQKKKEEEELEKQLKAREEEEALRSNQRKSSVKRLKRLIQLEEEDEIDEERTEKDDTLKDKEKQNNDSKNKREEIDGKNKFKNWLSATVDDDEDDENDEIKEEKEKRKEENQETKIKKEKPKRSEIKKEEKMKKLQRSGKEAREDQFESSSEEQKVEEDCEQTASSKNAVEQPMNAVRIKKTVDRTFMDADGFLVTERAQIDCTAELADQEVQETKVKENEGERNTEQKEKDGEVLERAESKQDVKKNEEVPSRKKFALKPSGKTNSNTGKKQSNLMSFFKPK